jgi:hypothetical protein
VSSRKSYKQQEPAPPSSAGSKWLFDSESEEEALPQQSTTNQSNSVLTRRVPGGVIHRTAQLDGGFVAELRLYNAEEVRGLTGIDRCQKALLWLRYQGEAESSELSLLKKFVKLTKIKFPSEGTFYKDKK